MEYWSNGSKGILPIHNRNELLFLKTQYSIFPPFHSSISLVKSCDSLKNTFRSRKSDTSNYLDAASGGFDLLLGSGTTAMYLHGSDLVMSPLPRSLIPSHLPFTNPLCRRRSSSTTVFASNRSRSLTLISAYSCLKGL